MSEKSATDAHSFQVDLRGLVDLLSHHLYSSPRVYVRELLQNAVDAITARRQGDPSAPAVIRITVNEAGLCISDSGIGLTEADAHRFLATIGNSSKRDDLAGARQEFLGQFGIGLLACFTVADQIRVVTRSARDPSSPVVEWLATGDGTYGVRRLDDAERTEPGTTVQLAPRAGAERWFAPELVAELARDYGSLLPYEVTVEGSGTTDNPPVWDRRHASARERRAALALAAFQRAATLFRGLGDDVRWARCRRSAAWVQFWDPPATQAGPDAEPAGVTAMRAVLSDLESMTAVDPPEELVAELAATSEQLTEMLTEPDPYDDEDEDDHEDEDE